MDIEIVMKNRRRLLHLLSVDPSEEPVMKGYQMRTERLRLVFLPDDPEHVDDLPSGAGLLHQFDFHAAIQRRGYFSARGEGGSGARGLQNEAIGVASGTAADVQVVGKNHFAIAIAQDAMKRFALFRS